MEKRTMITLAKTGAVERARRRCTKKFLFYFPGGFRDATYLEWERNYKFQAHQAFKELLNEEAYRNLLEAGKYRDIASNAIRIESRTNLLFSFEKMALRDAAKPAAGARAFAHGLFEYIYGNASLEQRFEAFTEVIASLPRKQTRVLTWPVQTVFGFIGNPAEHFFLKPKVTKLAAEKYQYAFDYGTRPNWETYQDVLAFAQLVKKDNKDLRPRDYIDLQSFIWVLGSDEYPD